MTPNPARRDPRVPCYRDADCAMHSCGCVNGWKRPTGTCDWGGCDTLAVDWRYSRTHGWLPVCHAHRSTSTPKETP